MTVGSVDVKESEVTRRQQNCLGGLLVCVSVSVCDSHIDYVL